jgi:dihydropteroate synthase
MHPVLTDLGRPRVMGILNVTPDSFSDGGRWSEPDAAIAHGLAMLADGADIIDVGGESTRPGAQRPEQEVEAGRVLPVIRALAEHGAVVSVDTMRADVAEAALEAGAVIVNDVSGGLADPQMLPLIASAEAVYVAMHWRAPSVRMQDFAVYDGPGGVVEDVRAELSGRVDCAVAAGIEPARLVLDPGLGFAKTAEHNWALIQGLGELASLGFPLLVGASRKAFLGLLLADSTGVPRTVEDREAANLALTVLLAQRGVWAVRVHDVRPNRDAIEVWTKVEDR